MAHFASGVFFGAKANALMTAAVLLLSTTVNSHVLKITDDDSASAEPRTSRIADGSTIEIEQNALVDEFLEIAKKLVKDAAYVGEEEEMQGDQPTGDLRNDDGSFTSTSRTRTAKDRNSNENNPYEWQRQMALMEIQMKVLNFTGHTGRPIRVGVTSSPTFPSSSLIPQTLPTLPNISSAYKREAIPPLCPIKNDDDLSISFNISDPKASSKDMILSVISADLKLYKIPLQENHDLRNEDETEVSKWRETFQKSDIEASERVITTKAEEQRMIQITVYKVRNKNKNHELKKLDTRMVQASLHGVTTWNIAKAINVWGNDTKKTLNLVISVENDRGNKLPANKIFEMRCRNNLERPVPLETNRIPSATSHTAWINLATEERPAKAEAYNGAASTVNRFVKDSSPSG